MLCSVDDEVTYFRPTLRKSAWLYLVLTLQPFLTISMLLTSTPLYSTPIGQNFGLISIHPGIDRSCLDAVAGAGLSGKLDKEIKLDIGPVMQEGKADWTLVYQLSTSLQDIPNSGRGRLARHVIYN